MQFWLKLSFQQEYGIRNTPQILQRFIQLSFNKKNNKVTSNGIQHDEKSFFGTKYDFDRFNI